MQAVSKNSIPTRSEVEMLELERKMELLEPKMHNAKKEYDSLVEQYTELFERRFPEKKEERIKDELYKAYMKDNRTLEEILTYISGEDESLLL